MIVTSATLDSSDQFGTSSAALRAKLQGPPESAEMTQLCDSPAGFGVGGVVSAFAVSQPAAVSGLGE